MKTFEAAIINTNTTDFTIRGSIFGSARSTKNDVWGFPVKKKLICRIFPVKKKSIHRIFPVKKITIPDSPSQKDETGILECRILFKLPQTKVSVICMSFPFKPGLCITQISNYQQNCPCFSASTFPQKKTCRFVQSRSFDYRRTSVYASSPLHLYKAVPHYVFFTVCRTKITQSSIICVCCRLSCDYLIFCRKSKETDKNHTIKQTKPTQQMSTFNVHSQTDKNHTFNFHFYCTCTCANHQYRTITQTNVSATLGKHIGQYIKHNMKSETP